MAPAKTISSADSGGCNRGPLPGLSTAGPATISPMRLLPSLPLRTASFGLLLFALAAAPTAIAQDGWLPTWAPADMPLTLPATVPLGKQDLTLRQVVHISQGGKRLRITFTNEFGTEPLHIAAAHVAFLSAGSKILPDTDRTLTFAGKPDITIAPGAFASSDGINETVPVFSDLVISTAVPAQAISKVTGHALAVATTYIAAGDQTAALEFAPAAVVPPGTPQPDLTAPLQGKPGDKPIVAPDTAHPQSQAGAGPTLLALTTSWYLLKNVEVNSNNKSAVVITFGDSITDGAQSTPDTNRRWPDGLATALITNKKTKDLALVNAGISGNRVLYTGSGPSALDRWDRDVLSQPGARYVIVLEGINDIGNMHRAPADAITEQQLIDAYTTLANRSHAKGIKIIAATVLPYEGAKYASPDGELIRQHLNAFLRSSPLFDGVIDFEKAMQDPEHPGRILPKYECGDHLHPSDAGYAAMAAAINVKLFSK